MIAEQTPYFGLVPELSCDLAQPAVRQGISNSKLYGNGQAQPRLLVLDVRP